jgi:hypothetical protein
MRILRFGVFPLLFIESGSRIVSEAREEAAVVVEGKPRGRT